MGATCTRMDDRYGVLRKPSIVEPPTPSIEGKVLNGYKIEGMLGVPDARGRTVTFKCTKNSRTYAVKGVLGKVLSKNESELLMEVGSDHETIHPLKDFFTCGTSTYLVSDYLPSVTDAIVTEKVASSAVVSILAAIRFLESYLGVDVSLNIKPANLKLKENSKPLLLDWYVPTLLGSTTPKTEDRQGLGEWIHNRVFSPDQPLSSIPELYKSFLRELTTTNANIHSHKWLLSARPAPLLSLQSTNRNRHEIDTTLFATTAEMKLRLLKWAGLWGGYGNNNTDRYFGRDMLKGVVNMSQNALETSGGTITKTTLEEMRCPMSPPTLGSTTSIKRPGLEAIWFTDRGSRTVNEDAVFVVPDLTALYQGKVGNDFGMAVFDGHGGVEAADFCAQHLLPTIQSHPSYATDVKTAIREGYASINSQFLELSEKHGMDCGATATVVIVKDNRYIHVGCVGDSTALISINGLPHVLTKDHRACDPAEKAAVESRGGSVLSIMGSDRVQGLLQVTRSIGDLPCSQYLSCDPDVFQVQITPEYEFLVIASDGLWDVMSPVEVVKYITECKQEVEASFDKLSTCSSFPTPGARRQSGDDFDRRSSFQDSSSVTSLRRSLRRRAFTEVQGGGGTLEFKTDCSSALAASEGALVSTSSRASEPEVRYEDYQVICEALVAEARQRGSTDDCSICLLLFQ